MSDSILRIHATDPEYQPDEETAMRARDAAESLFPGAAVPAQALSEAIGVRMSGLWAHY